MEEKDKRKILTEWQRNSKFEAFHSIKHFHKADRTKMYADKMSHTDTHIQTLCLRSRTQIPNCLN